MLLTGVDAHRSVRAGGRHKHEHDAEQDRPHRDSVGTEAGPLISSLRWPPPGLRLTQAGPLVAPSANRHRPAPGHSGTGGEGLRCPERTVLGWPGLDRPRRALGQVVPIDTWPSRALPTTVPRTTATRTRWPLAATAPNRSAIHTG